MGAGESRDYNIHLLGYLAGKLNLAISIIQRAGPRLPFLHHRLNDILSLSHSRYEDEINKRTTAENEFVTLKKVS